MIVVLVAVAVNQPNASSLLLALQPVGFTSALKLLGFRNVWNVQLVFTVYWLAAA